MRTEDERARISKGCRASVERRRAAGKVPGRGSTPETEAERANKISEARMGMKFSDEHRAKLSAAHKGLKRSKATRKKMSLAHLQRFKRVNPTACRMCSSSQHTTAEHHSLARAGQKKKEAIREQETGSARPWMTRRHTWMVGAKNWRWKGGGGYRPSPNFRRLRSIVLARDGYKCFQCGCDNKRLLVAHHIDRNHRHTYLDNLITLCRGDNGRAEHEPWKTRWQRKFSCYTKAIIYTIE